MITPDPPLPVVLVPSDPVVVLVVGDPPPAPDLTGRRTGSRSFVPLQEAQKAKTKHANGRRCIVGSTGVAAPCRDASGSHRSHTKWVWPLFRRFVSHPGGERRLLLVADRRVQRALAARQRSPRDVVRSLPFQGDDEQLVESLRRGHPPAVAYFYSTFVKLVHRLLFRLLGPDSELEDTVHDTFVRALQSVHRLRDPALLRSWLVGVAVVTARIRMQSRKRRRWLMLFPPEKLPERSIFAPSLEISEALRATFAILERLPPDERVAVVLRIVERMPMLDAAHACGVSLSTFKRRLRRGEEKFRELVMAEPRLRDWVLEENDES
jgi:RNA polymerase sigma-70 factor (ECF subfamily)